MAQGGLRFEAEAVADELAEIIGSTPKNVREPLIAAEKRLRHAATTYPLSTPGASRNDLFSFRLSPEADEAAVALSQFAGIKSIPGGTFVLFSDDLADAQVIARPNDIIALEGSGKPIARVPLEVADSLAEARANLVAGLAWLLELTTCHLENTPQGKQEPLRERAARVSYFLFGGS